jgi:hypothetical protein
MREFELAQLAVLERIAIALERIASKIEHSAESMQAVWLSETNSQIGVSKKLSQMSALDFVAQIGGERLPHGFHVRTSNVIKNTQSNANATEEDITKYEWMRRENKYLKDNNLPKGIVTVTDLISAVQKDLRFPNFGKKCKDTILRAVAIAEKS